MLQIGSREIDGLEVYHSFICNNAGSSGFFDIGFVQE